MGQEDWSRWLDEDPGPDESVDAEPEASVLQLPRQQADEAPAAQTLRPRPILVVGGCGGAGTTTTVLGLAAALAGAGSDAVAVDATSAGGDLALRGADEVMHPTSLQAWMYGHGLDDPLPVDDCMSRSSSGAGLLWRDAGPLRRRASYGTVGRALASAGYTPVYDGGNPIAARQLRPLLDDPDIALVLTIPARADAANRLRVTLEWLDDELGDAQDYQGQGIVAETTIVVSHQLDGGEPAVADHLKRNLSGWVREVTEIPYDPHLARGELITYADLAASTHEAYSTLLQGVLT